LKLDKGKRLQENSPRVLLAPLHFYFQNLGSEVGWAYEYVTHYPNGRITAFVANNFDKPSSSSANIVEFYRHEYRISRVNSFIFHIRCYISARKYLEPNINIIHHFMPFAIGTTFNLFSILKPKSARYKIVIGPIQSTHTFPDHKQTKLSKAAERPFRILSRLTLKNADMVLASNDIARRDLIKFGVQAEKIEIVPRGIDTNQFSVNFSEPTSTLNVLVVAYLYKRKGIDLVIRAISECKKRGKHVRLDIVGEGPVRSELEFLIDTLDIGTEVKLHGFVVHDEIQTFYSHAHVFVSMSRSEAFATTPLEAMACGLPIIATPTGGFVESIDEGNTGYLIGPEDHEELATKLCYLADNPRVLVKMSNAAHQLVTKKFDWDKVIIPKFIDIYKALIRQ
jgi:glycosyltransferase involved in cell wall biosynthesis